MLKWTMPLQIIPIGLNLISILFLTGCDLFNSDPSLVKYSDRYNNLSGQDISLVFSSEIEGVHVFSLASGSFYDRERVTWNDGNTAEQFIIDLYGDDTMNMLIYLISSSDTLQAWTGPSAFMGDSINNPFNYDSWEVNNEAKVVQFTIIESDLK